MKAMDVESGKVFDWATDRVRRQNLPLPKKPRGTDPEYDVVDDPDSLSSVELGQRMSRFAAWLTYCMRLVGTVESELVLVEAEYKLRVNAAMIDAREALPGRPSADLVEAYVLRESDELGLLYKRKLELVAIKAQLEPRLRIYDKSWQALSRELTRREIESRVQ